MALPYMATRKALAVALALLGAILSFVTLAGQGWVKGDMRLGSATGTFKFGVFDYTTKGDVGSLHTVSKEELVWCYDANTAKQSDKLYIGDGKKDCDRARCVVAFAILGGILGIIAAVMCVPSSIHSKFAAIPAILGAIFSGVTIPAYPKDDVCNSMSGVADVPFVEFHCHYGPSRTVAIIAAVSLSLSALIALSIPRQQRGAAAPLLGGNV